MKSLNASASKRLKILAILVLLAAALVVPALAQNAAWDSRFNANGFSGQVRAIAIAPNGHVFAGGEFTTTVGGTPVNRVAEWDGQAWSALGNNGVSDRVHAIAVDSNNNVYVGGIFTTAGGGIAGRIARWDGSSWTSLDGGMTNDVFAVAVDESDNVYAGGAFTVAGGVAAARIAMWDGNDWNALAGGMSDAVNTIAIAPNGDVIAGGVFTVAGGTTALRVARWNGSSWSALGGGLSDVVNAVAVAANGDVFTGGTFTTAGGSLAGRVARWNGSAWSALAGGMSDAVYALSVNGGDLYAGGTFTVAGGSSILRIARWNGSSWSGLGDGVTDAVWAIRAQGNDVFAGGAFTVAGGQPSLRFGRYNPDIVPVFIQEFTARGFEDRVDLEWRVWSDDEVSGYRVYRRESGDAGFIALDAGRLLSGSATSHSDNDVEPGASYGYRLAAITPGGAETLSRTIAVRVPATGFVLDQNFPNPFNPITTIRFAGPAGVAVRVDVYDAAGRFVANLFDGVSAGGAVEVQWNGRTAAGVAAGTGVYFYRLTAGKETLTRKMLLLK